MIISHWQQKIHRLAKKKHRSVGLKSTKHRFSNKNTESTKK
jgi:hypothetical protein